MNEWMNEWTNGMNERNEWNEWMNEWMNESNWPDCMRMRRQDLEGGRGIMEQLTQAGNPEAQMGVGFLYATGQETYSSYSPTFV